VVDESSPFCPNCGTPQIRFAPAESSEQLFRVNTPETHEQVPIRAQPAFPLAGLDKNSAFRSALAAGGIAALLSLLPLGFIIGAPLGGFLSVLLYRRRSWSGDPSPGAAFRLGALSGILGYAIFLFVAAAQLALSRGQNELRDVMVEAVHRQEARNPDPQARQMLEYFLTPHGLMVMMVAGLVLMAILFVVLSGLGGSISAALLRRKEPPS
jgi:MFS family permease